MFGREPKGAVVTAFQRSLLLPLFILYVVSLRSAVQSLSVRFGYYKIFPFAFIRVFFGSLYSYFFLVKSVLLSEIRGEDDERKAHNPVTGTHVILRKFEGPLEIFVTGSA